MATSMWDAVVGQDRAVEMLQRAATRPVHAYLLVGPRGSGIETAARCFAAMLIGADGDDRVLRGRHPDVVEFRPVATMYSVERDVRDAILPAVHASPIETDRKCVLLLEADRLNPESSNTLLKSIEEPPPRTIVILVAESAAEILETIRSRCQEIDFGALGTEVLLQELERREVPDARARLVAALAGGRLDRAVALAGPLAGLRDAFADVPARIDGNGATALALANGLGEVIKDTLAELEAGQEAELAELEVEIDHQQYAARTASAMRKRVTDRQKRGSPPRPDRRAARGHHRDRVGLPRRARCRRPGPERGPGAARGPAGRRHGRVRRLSGGPGRVRVQPERDPAPGAPSAPSPGRRAERAPIDCSASAGIAQSVEQLTRNEQVRSSNLLPGSTRVTALTSPSA